jgi:hypothetical protein
MTDDSVKRSAEEYLATRLSADGLTYEETLNREAAIFLSPAEWTEVGETVATMCDEWNSVTKEPTLNCEETILGDLRIRCSGRPHQLILHYDSRRLLIRVENTAREDHEPKVVLFIEGYPTGSGRGARLMRNNEPVNLRALMLGHLRVLAGLSRRVSE